MGKDDERTPPPDVVISVDDMTDEQLGQIIQSSIYLSEAYTRYKRSDHVDLNSDQKNDIVNLVIEIWRIKEIRALYAIASDRTRGGSRQFEVEIDHDYHVHPKWVTDEREAVDSVKGKIISIITPKSLPTLPASAYGYPKNAINELVEMKQREKPRPPKPDLFHGRL